MQTQIERMDVRLLRRAHGYMARSACDVQPGAHTAHTAAGGLLCGGLLPPPALHPLCTRSSGERWRAHPLHSPCIAPPNSALVGPAVCTRTRAHARPHLQADLARHVYEVSSLSLRLSPSLIPLSLSLSVSETLCLSPRLSLSLRLLSPRRACVHTAHARTHAHAPRPTLHATSTR
jgi:hypothetical protein